MKKKINNFLCAFIVISIMVALVFALFYAKPKPEEAVTDTLQRAKNDSVYNFLLLGRDSAAGLCDVVILGTVNTDNGNISFMQIPRDTYFNCSSTTYKKINGAYNSLGSASKMTSALSESLGIKIDYYLCLGLDAIEKMVDAVHGIEVNIPMDMDYTDPEQNLSIKLNAGNQILNGKNAVQFLRYRSGYITGDLGRIDAQKLFLNAFAKRVANLGNPLSLYNLFKIICENSESNLKANDLISIAFKCAQAKTGKVSYMTAPGEAIQSQKSGAWYYILSASSMTELLRSRFDMVDTFDKDYKFVDKNAKAFYDIYNKNCEVKIYTADDIENNKININ